jgi:signal transduction histidine kinase
MKNNHHFDNYLKNMGLDAGPHILFSIKDTGTGMGKNNIDKIFDPYFSTKSKGKGTGLGLSVVPLNKTHNQDKISYINKESTG